MKSLLIAFLIAALAPEPTVASVRRVIAHDMNASVLLHMKGIGIADDGKIHKLMAECSGTYTDSKHILTAAHCFEGYNVDYIWARGPNELLGYPVYIVRLDAAKDLALLESPFSHPYVKVGKAPRLGQSIHNIGSPHGFEFVLSQGIVALSHYKVAGFIADYFVTTAMINPGSSGGGCFNAKGELIGVNTMSVGLMGWQGLSITVGVETVKEFLK